MAEPAALEPLVRQARQGDRRAFDRLVRRFQNAGYAVALGRVRDPDDAEDVLQDAFVAAYLKLGQLRDVAAFPGWFRSIVQSQCHMWLRQRLREQRRDVDGTVDLSPPLPAADPEARVRGHRLWSHVHALREPYRSAALLHYLSGFSHAEIAAFLQVPLATVNGRLQQSRIRLRDTLDPDELKEIDMSRIDVAPDVADALYQVESLPLQRTVPLEGRRHVVLYCGVNTDLRVEAAAGDELVLDGARVSMGLSPEAARQSAERIQLQADAVDDYVAAGPHEGELFWGSNHVDGKPQTSTWTTTEQWRGYQEGRGYGVGNLQPQAVFPDLAAHFLPFPDDVAATLRDVVRLSLVQDQCQALTLPPDAYRESLHKVFRPNSQNPRWLHGPLGYAALTVSLPADAALTVIGADEIDVSGVRGRLHLIQCTRVRAEDITGDLVLLDSPVESVRRLQGRVVQRWYSFGGMNWSSEDGIARRSREFVSRLEDVEGTVDLDVGRADLDLRRCRGDVRVHNRHGATRLTLDGPPGDSRYRLESVSGAVRACMPAEIMADLRFGIFTLCGSVDYRVLGADADKGSANSRQLAALSSIPPTGGRWSDVLDAELLIRTESGNIALETLE